MGAKLYECQYPNCENVNKIRTKVKDKDSEYYGLYVCPYHGDLLRVKKTSDKTRRTQTERKEQRKDYSQFYSELAEKIKGWRCVNCRNILKGDSINLAHILAKSTSPEVATHDLNIMFLCEDCHTTFDSNLQNRSKMPCFENSVKRYNIIKPLLTNVTGETMFYDKYIEDDNK